MLLLPTYNTLTRKLNENPDDIQTLLELVKLYPLANQLFDYEIINSIELYVSELGNNPKFINLLKKIISDEQDKNIKFFYSSLLEGLNLLNSPSQDVK